MPLKLVKKGKTWHVDGYVNGVRHRESTHTGSREHAEAKRKDLERDLEDRAYHKSSVFADAVNIYGEKGGEMRYVKPLLDNLEGMRLRDITPVVVSALSTKLYGHCEPGTVRRHFYTPLNAIMRKAHQAHLCPLTVFDAPKVKRKPVDYANDQWLRTFLEHAFQRIALTVLFMTLTGARVTEACRLAVGDLDLSRGFALLRLTKNGKSRRVSLAPMLVDALRAWIIDQRLLDPAAPVFGYASRYSVNQAIERVCAKAGIPYLSSHKVGRHAFAARLLAEGKSLKLLQEAGGWSSMQLVADTYGHLEQSMVDEALRETGTALLTKMGSAVPTDRKSRLVGQVLDTLEDDGVFRGSTNNHDLPAIAGDSDGGRCRDRTYDPTRVKMGVIGEKNPGNPENPDNLQGR